MNGKSVCMEPLLSRTACWVSNKQIKVAITKFGSTSSTSMRDWSIAYPGKTKHRPPMSRKRNSPYDHSKERRQNHQYVTIHVNGTSVLPRGSAVRAKENLTRPAPLRTRSVGLQTASPAETRSVATQTANFTTDMGSLQPWRSIQAACRIELQGPQHRIGTTARLSTSTLQGLHDRIKSITLDMDSLNRSCRRRGGWRCNRWARSQRRSKTEDLHTQLRKMSLAEIPKGSHRNAEFKHRLQLWEAGEIRELVGRVLVRQEEKVLQRQTDEQWGKRACALAGRGSISKTTKGLVEPHRAQQTKHWTTALIPRSSGFGTHPTSTGMRPTSERTSGTSGCSHLLRWCWTEKASVPRT